MRSVLSLSIKRSVLALTAASVVTLTGCGIGAPAGPVSTTFQSVTGHIHGGQTPIVGATVTLYATGSTGYGAGATVLGTGRSDSYSNFVITLVQGATCPAGSQAYITAAGGGANYQPANVAMLEMAALGSCSSVNATTFTTINELTTVAAAYALSGFTTTSASNGLYAANVGAPATNNALATAITSTTPAGLTHAFMNAANLVNPVTGAAQTSATANSNGGTVTGSVPVAELNTLADIMQACVDAGAVPNTSCTTLFGITGGSNTLQAFVNLARNPYPTTSSSTGSASIATLLTLVSATPAFQPTLTAAPIDLSVSIVWGHATLPLAYFLATDANDTLIFGLYTTSASTPAMYGVSPYGVSVPVFASQTTGTTSRFVAPDALGNIWLANNANNMDRFSSSTGALLSTYISTYAAAWPLAVDRQNNLWIGHVNSSAGVTVEEAAYTAPVSPSTTPTWVLNYTATTPANSGSYGLTIDAAQNVWDAGYYAATGATANLSILLPNLGTASAPSYTLTGTAITPITTTVGTKPYSTVIDGNGNGWVAITGATNSLTTTGIQEVMPNAKIGATATTAQTQIFGSTAGSNGNVLGTLATEEMAIDGAGTIFIPDNNASTQGIHMYSTTSANTLTPSTGLKSCYLSTATTTVCGTTSGAAVYNPRIPAIDSTGSVWAGETGGGIVQIIGVAAPTYPLLSVGRPSTMP
jgi:hypothetical protein